MWFKKKSVLQAEGHYNSNTAVDGTDWRTLNKQNNWAAYPSLPSVADANKYFYLPALGWYWNTGQLSDVGNIGNYWSSSAVAMGGSSAYYMEFYSGHVYVNTGYRGTGYRVGGFE